MTQLEEWSLDCEKQNCGGGIDSNLDAEKSGHGCERDIVAYAESFDEMDNEFLNQVRAVRDTGDESCSRNCNATKEQPRADGANQKSRHAERDERKLPDASGDGEIIALAQIQSINNERESGKPEPKRVIHQSLPPLRPEFFDGGQCNPEHERVEPGPGRIINPGLETAEGNAAIN